MSNFDLGRSTFDILHLGILLGPAALLALSPLPLEVAPGNDEADDRDQQQAAEPDCDVTPHDDASSRRAKLR